MIQHIGKVAEYLVLAELIKKDVEAYSAISFHQEHYDITVIRSDKTISRIQVKATELQNKSTNNPVSNLNKVFDYLVLVVFDGLISSYYVMTKAEVEAEFASGKPGTMYTSKMAGGKYVVKDAIAQYENLWLKITG
ncbi:hypothetical protein [Pseudomonas sp. Q1-7]|uniref:hypothetical protein n=1 Tax=Pseudomonas sp. Q1-7 TaxID=3020843 RepID=UPI002300B96E|nr:hypothetical protein [Pseudomonas sp. Q1-7]